MSSKNFQLILESVSDNNPEDLTRIKTILLTDLSFDLEQAKDIIENLPHPIATSADINILRSISELFSKTEAVLDILPIIETTVIPPNINFFTENIDNKPSPEQIIKNRAISHKDYSVFEINTSAKTEGTPNLLTRYPIIFNSLISILFASLMVGLTFLIFSGAPKEDDSVAILNQIETLKKEALLKKQEEKEFVAETNYVANFVIAGITFEFSITRNSNNIISSITVQALNNKESSIPEQFEKVMINNLRVSNSIDNSFTARGMMKIYINQAGQLVRPTAQSYVGGSYNPETDQITARLLVNRGYDDLPSEEKFIINPSDLEETKIFIDRNITLGKQQ